MSKLRAKLEELVEEHGLDAVIEELDEIEKEELGLDDDDESQDEKDQEEDEELFPDRD